MGGSGVAFGHHSVGQIIVFFILTLFVVDNKMVENTVCLISNFLNEALSGIFKSSRNKSVMIIGK